MTEGTITITSNDLPITVAEKLITATKPANTSPFLKGFAVAVTGNEDAGDEEDMFSMEELEEIAIYLQTYCKWHEGGD